MSDNWIALISEDPYFVPDEGKLERARDWFTQIAPEADQIEIKTFETIEFFDCGANLERIGCSQCREEISVDWWQDRMDEDYNSDFTLAKYPVPCCATKLSLNELEYEWPQGFGRFALDAMNPNIGKLDDKHKLEFESILGTKLRVIYQHI